MRTRSFYVMTLRTNAKKKDLIKFLEKEWVPALKSCQGCLEVEILADFGDRAGFFATELWDFPEAHSEHPPTCGAPRGLISGRRLVNCQGFNHNVSVGVYHLKGDSAGGGVSRNGFINSERNVKTTSFRLACSGLKSRLKNSSVGS